MSYRSEYERSNNHPEDFWREQADCLQWFKSPKAILQKQDDIHYQWFADGELNTSYLALDAHIANERGDQVALYYDSPVTNTKKTYTFKQLHKQVAKTAGMLRSLNVQKGDRVLIYMPMIPQAAIAMLACARLGAVHSVVFGGFAANELKVRIDDAKPKVILGASCGIEVNKVLGYKPLLDEAIELAQHKPESCVIYQRSQLTAKLDLSRDFDWQDLLENAPEVDAISVKSTDPLYILYTSGTTGKPKGVVRDNGGHAVAMNYSMKTVYGMKPGEVFWAASDVGWVVGHSYIVYAPLIYGCSTVLYEGKPIKTPDAGAFWRVVEEYKVNALFSAPTAFRAIRKEDPKGDLMKVYDLSSLQKLFLAGERLDPATYDWLNQATGLPVLDHWWQTETGWAIACNPVGLESVSTKAGSASLPTPGFRVDIIGEDGELLDANEQGKIAINLPLPPGCFPSLWQDDERYCESYFSQFKGYYLTGDGGFIDDDGYLFVMGRIDDVINVAGHRLSTGEMEEVVASHCDIAECAVVGVKDEMKGEVPIAFVVLRSDAKNSNIENEVIQTIRKKIGAIACLKNVFPVARLPKTRSGKILRRTLKQIYQGESFSIPSTIDDASILDEIGELFSQQQLAS